MIDKGSTETYAVGSMDSTTGEITELVVSETSVDQNDGIVVCAHGCNDVCVQHDDCLTCKADATCGWSFDKGCFEYDTSMITGLEKTGTCVDPTAPAPRMGPDGKIHFGPADMFDTPSPGGWIGGKKGPPLDLLGEIYIYTTGSLTSATFNNWHGVVEEVSVLKFRIPLVYT